MEADLRALAADTLEIRVEEQRLPGGEHWSLWGLLHELLFTDEYTILDSVLDIDKIEEELARSESREHGTVGAVDLQVI